MALTAMRMVILLTALTVLTTGEPAIAVETRIPADRLAPPPGNMALWGVEDPLVVGHLKVLLGLGWSVAGSPVALSHSERITTAAVVPDPVRRLGTLQLSSAVELWRQLRLGLALPLLIPSGAGLVGLEAAALPSAAVSDLRLHVTAAMRRAGQTPPIIQAALAAILAIPTGDGESFTGLGTAAFEPRILLAVQPLRVLSVRGQLGVALHEEREVFGARWGNRLTWGVAAELRLPWVPVVGRQLGVVCEMDGTSCGGCDSAPPLELRAGLRLKRSRWHISIGAGGGVDDGVTTPTWRVLGAVGAVLGR